VTLVGKNYAGYGEFLDENFIQMLENFAKTTAPAAPLTGQLWFNKTNNLLNVYNGTDLQNTQSQLPVLLLLHQMSKVTCGMTLPINS
jgi:hypothetical protein